MRTQGLRQRGLARGRATKAGAVSSRQADSKRTRDDIIAVATEQFAAKGLSGARIDEIAARTKTSKRMIYYHFRNKEGLYIAVLEEAYRMMRTVDAQRLFEDAAPEEALRKLVSFTFDQHCGHQDYIRLIMNENLHWGRYLRRSKKIHTLNVPAIEALASILKRGQAQHVFRTDITPVDLHMSISALCFHYVANRYTFSTIFKIDMTSADARQARKAQIVDMVAAVIRHPAGWPGTVTVADHSRAGAAPGRPVRSERGAHNH